MIVIFFTFSYNEETSLLLCGPLYLIDGVAGEQGHHQQGQREGVDPPARVWSFTQLDQGSGGLNSFLTLFSDKFAGGQPGKYLKQKLNLFRVFLEGVVDPAARLAHHVCG